MIRSSCCGLFFFVYSKVVVKGSMATSLPASASPIPLKIYLPSRGLQIGVAAKSLRQLHEILRARVGLTERYKLTLEDGTIVCDPEYFKLLEPQTKLNVVEVSHVSVGVGTTTTTNGEYLLKKVAFSQISDEDLPNVKLSTYISCSFNYRIVSIGWFSYKEVVSVGWR